MDEFSRIVDQLRELEAEHLQEQQLLYGRVEKRLQPPSADAVDEAEKAIGVHFHPDFRRYLLEVSDVEVGAIDPVRVTHWAPYSDLRSLAKAAWEEFGISRALVPICYSNADLYCVTEDGRVVFWSHDVDGLTGEEWPTIANWIKRVWVDESIYG